MYNFLINCYNHQRTRCFIIVSSYYGFFLGYELLQRQSFFIHYNKACVPQ